LGEAGVADGAEFSERAADGTDPQLPFFSTLLTRTPLVWSVANLRAVGIFGRTRGAFVSSPLNDPTGGSLN
jgi:hypothetical protein